MSTVGLIAGILAVTIIVGLLLLQRHRAKQRGTILGGMENGEEGLLEARQELQALWEKGHIEFLDLVKKDPQFQAPYAAKAEAAKQKYGKRAHPCPKCGAAADKLGWFYYKSPPPTWKMLCGHLGWMTVCQQCDVQVDFFPEVIS
jgi:hypothetical protein